MANTEGAGSGGSQGDDGFVIGQPRPSRSEEVDLSDFGEVGRCVLTTKEEENYFHAVFTLGWMCGQANMDAPPANEPLDAANSYDGESGRILCKQLAIEFEETYRDADWDEVADGYIGTVEVFMRRELEKRLGLADAQTTNPRVSAIFNLLRPHLSYSSLADEQFIFGLLESLAGPQEHPSQDSDSAL